jgi:hypothetical protein
MKITKTVKKFGHYAAHVTLPKNLIGKEVQIISDLPEPEREYYTKEEVRMLIKGEELPLDEKTKETNMPDCPKCGYPEAECECETLVDEKTEKEPDSITLEEAKYADNV